MNESAIPRLFGVGAAFEDPLVVGVVIALPLLLLIAFALTVILHRTGKIGDERYRELILRLKSWAVLIPCMLVPVLLGAFWTILALLILAILCYREFARMTGQFRNYRVSGWTVVGIILLFMATLDHWYNLFMAIQPLGVVLIAGAGIYVDRPEGYLQRISLGVLAFLLFGSGLGHVAYLANDIDFRPLLILLLVAVEMNDIFAYLCGTLFGRNKLCPNTSPGKTREGAIGAVICTALLVLALGSHVFAETIPSLWHLLILGVIISVSGQLGDLIMSSVKRDLGRKDTDSILPGHGGLLDRFDSLLVAGPAYFHFVGYFQGVGLEEASRIFTGS